MDQSKLVYNEFKYKIYMTNVFVKIDSETKKLKIQSKEEESFKKISIGDVSKNTLSNIFLKALDDSDMQSPSIQTEIDTEQNFWKHFFQQKDIDSDYFIYSISLYSSIKKRLMPI